MHPTLAVRHARGLAYVSANSSPDRSYELALLDLAYTTKYSRVKSRINLSNFVETYSSTRQGPQKPIYRHSLFQAQLVMR